MSIVNSNDFCRTHICVTRAQTVKLLYFILQRFSLLINIFFQDTQNNYDQLYLAPEGKSGIELFFDSMAQTVKRLPPKAQADIKMNICKIVTEAELRYSGRNTPQSTQQFIAPPGMIPKLVLIPCNMIDGQNNKD